VAEALQVEQRSRLVRIVEDESRCLVDRRRTRAGDRIGRGAGMDLQGIEAVGRGILRRAGRCRSRLVLRFHAQILFCFLELMTRVLTPIQPISRLRRPNSILGQRFITTFRPAASAFFAASSWRTPSCIHSTLAPILIASSASGGIASEARKQSTMSILTGISDSEA